MSQDILKSLVDDAIVLSLHILQCADESDRERRLLYLEEARAAASTIARRLQAQIQQEEAHVK